MFVPGHRIDEKKLKVVDIPDGCISYRVRSRIDEIISFRLRFEDRIEHRYAEYVDRDNDPYTIRPSPSGVFKLDIAKTKSRQTIGDTSLAATVLAVGSTRFDRRGLLRMLSLGTLQ